MTESTLQRKIMLAASEAGWSIWRNNVGVAWQGRRQNLSGATVTLRNGVSYRPQRGILLQDQRAIEYGLCPGSSDLIGFRPLTITADMVGATIAQFCAIEVKTDTGRLKPKQHNFGTHVQDRGGLFLVARSPGDVSA